MTEKRRFREQIAIHDYKRSRPTAEVHPGSRRRTAIENERRIAATAGSGSTRRVVTVPDAMPQVAWNEYAERRNRLYAERSRSQANTYTKMTPRTFAQTGVRAPGGQMRAIKRLPQYQSAAVPARSGQRNTRRGFWWKLIGFFTLLALIIVGTSFALTGSFFRIEHLSIVGAHNPLLVHNIQQLGIQGQNIFLVDVASLTNRTDALPVVASADMEKQWPNQMVVTVTERIPVMLWQTSQGTYSVDIEGAVIAPASETAGVTHLRTVVDGRKGDNASGRTGKTGIRPGARLNAADIAFAMQVFARLPEMTGVTNFTLRYDDTMPAPTGTTGMGGNGVFEVVSQAGWVAYLGGSNDTNPLDNRLIELQQILALAQQQQLNIATIDLRYGLRPVYTLKS
ncbi:MAG TPA: FtsQ-type POTRA domain-containing protein [Ktedonobacteraceae bacterium]|nr:FtsQ-type POTRA domain-containing protein [Ktedonobacteraceae bacterium]